MPHDIESRLTNGSCRDRWGNIYRCRSSWHNWGRWVLLAIIIGLAFVAFFFFAYVTSHPSGVTRRGRSSLERFADTLSPVDVSPLVNAVATANDPSTGPAGSQAHSLRQANGSNSNILRNRPPRRRDINRLPSMDMGRITVRTKDISASSSTDPRSSSHRTHMRKTAYIHLPWDRRRFIRSREYQQRCLRTNIDIIRGYDRN